MTLLPNSDGTFMIFVRGSGVDQDIPCDTLDKAKIILSDKLHELCEIAEKAEEDKLDDRADKIAQLLLEMSEGVEAVRVGLETLSKRQSHLRDWLVRLENRLDGAPQPKPDDKMPEYLPRKPKLAKAAKPFKRTLRTLAKVAKKPAKRAVKAKA